MIGVDLIKHRPAIMALAQFAKLPSQFTALFLTGGDRIAHCHPSAALHAVHQKSIASRVEQQCLIAQQRQMRISAGEGGGEGPDLFEFAHVGQGRFEGRWPEQLGDTKEQRHPERTHHGA